MEQQNQCEHCSKTWDQVKDADHISIFYLIPHTDSLACLSVASCSTLITSCYVTCCSGLEGQKMFAKGCADWSRYCCAPGGGVMPAVVPGFGRRDAPPGPAGAGAGGGGYPSRGGRSGITPPLQHLLLMLSITIAHLFIAALFAFLCVCCFGLCYRALHVAMHRCHVTTGQSVVHGCC